MNDKRVKIKYHQAYDPKLDENLSAAAIALDGEFSDLPAGDGAREMTFRFDNEKNLREFFRIFKALVAEKEEGQYKSRKDWLA